MPANWSADDLLTVRRSFTCPDGANFIKLIPSVIYKFSYYTSIGPWQAFQAWSNEHYGLLRKFLNNGQISFITLTPGANVINFFCS